MNFAKGSLITIVSKAVIFFSSLFISIYIARILGPQAKGTYYLLVQMVSIIVLSGMFGITNSAVYLTGKDEKSRPVLSGNLLFLTFLTSLIFFVLVLIFRFFLMNSILKDIPGQYIYLMDLAIPIVMFNQILLSMILGRNEIVIFNLSEIACSLLLFLNFIILVIFLRMGISGACTAFLLAYLIADIILLLFFVRHIRISIQWKTIKNILNYGLRSYLGPICLILISRIDSFMLNLFSDIRQVGFYSISVSLAELIPFVPLSVGVVLFPKLVSQEADRLNTDMQRVIRVMLFYLILLALGLFIFGKWLITFVYGKTYSPSVLPMYILLPGFVSLALYYLFFSYFNAAGRPETVTFVLLITLFVKVFLSIFTIPRWGMYGAAATSTFSYILCGILFILAFKAKFRGSLKDMFLIKKNDIQYVYNFFSSYWV